MKTHRMSGQLGLELPDESPVELGPREAKDLVNALAQLLQDAAAEAIRPVAVTEAVDDDEGE
jgi:hypothetical protein